jgi:hypothetical protein
LVGALVLVAGGETTANADIELGFELLLFVERADDLLGVENLALLAFGNVAGGHSAFFVYRELERADLVVVGLELDFFEIENDVDGIFHHSRQGAELVESALDFHRGDRGPLEGAEKHSAEGVSDGVPVSGLKRLGDKAGIGFRGSGLVFDESFRHFEPTETNRHVINRISPGYPVR